MKRQKVQISDQGILMHRLDIYMDSENQQFSSTYSQIMNMLRLYIVPDRRRILHFLVKSYSLLGKLEQKRDANIESEDDFNISTTNIESMMLLMH